MPAHNLSSTALAQSTMTQPTLSQSRLPPTGSATPALSPLARYQLRKLFHKPTLSTAPKAPRSIAPSTHKTLPAPLPRSIAPRSTEQSIQQLETRLLMHQELSKPSHDRLVAQRHSFINPTVLATLEQEIFQLLGLRTTSLQVRSQILAETDVHCFAFVYDNEICNAIAHDGKYYGLITFLSSHQRLAAYQYDWLLRSLGISTMLTVSDNRYRLWVDLRASSYPILRKQGTQFLQRLQSFQSALRKFQQNCDRKFA
jgi:hypothetical protein